MYFIEHLFENCDYVKELPGGKYIEIHSQDADHRIGQFKLWFHGKGGHERECLQSYAKEWQYRCNHTRESM